MDHSIKDQLNSSSVEEAVAVYEALLDGDDIRYMVLQAGKYAEPLECRLLSSSLREMPYFEAVSYVWGSDLKEHAITCNGQSIGVTHNLWKVLKETRLPHQSRTLWVDSICINQEDLDEKAAQISLMGPIYSKANRVLICLGSNDNGHAQVASSLVEELDEMILKGLRNAKPSYGSFPFPNADEQEQRAGDARWKSLLALTEEPWFERGWVVQEAGLSDTAVIQWGGIDMEWHKVVRVWTWMEQRLPQVWTRNPLSTDRMNGLHLEVYRIRNREKTMPMYNTSNPAEVAFLELFHYARPLQFKERSDRVYAFLALASSTTLPINVQPDYKKHCYEVYVDLARQYIISTQSIRILEYIQHTEATIQDNYPSWAPRWDVNTYEVRIVSPYGTDLKLQPTLSLSNRRVEFSDKNVLKVQGVLIDQVGFISKEFIEKPSIYEITTLQNILSQNMRSTLAYAVFDQDIAFIAALSVGRHIGDRERWQLCRTAYIQRLKEEAESNGHEEDHYDMVHYWVQSCTLKRRFILTERGYFGLAPSVTSANDICCILDGALSPIILRETSTPRHYKVIGDVYIPSKQKWPHSSEEGGDIMFSICDEGGRDWVDWGVDKQDIYLC